MKNRFSVRLILIVLLGGMLLGAVACQSAPENPSPSDTSAVSVPSGTDTAEDPASGGIGTPKLYRAMYNSDTTNIMQCASPYHATNQDSPLTKKMVEANVTEAIDAGADCFVICPGHCWVPWWPSQYLKEHSDWFFDEFGGKNASNPFWTYVHVKGHDFIQEQIAVCRKRNVGAFISYRMNDAHMINKVTPETADIAFAAEIFVDHPEYRINENSVLDFRFKEVRDYKLKLIRELIENYEIDGFELDFCRRFALFNRITEEERLRIMIEFISEVRAMLDAETAKDGRYRHLSVRIPIYSDLYAELGIDLTEYEKAGVTIFNFTSSYFMDQEFNLANLKKRIRSADVYCELNFCTAVGYDEEHANQRYHRRATIEQYATTALIAYEQGADGISFFNFVYYRGDRLGEMDKPLTEPPWEVIEMIKDRKKLEAIGQSYYFGQTWKDPIKTTWKLPNILSKSVRTDFSMYLVMPEGGWKNDGLFRLQSLVSMAGRSFTVTVNGTTLSPTAYTGEPYENEYTQMRGTAENYACFTVPKELLKSGRNQIYVTLTSGSSIELCFVELTIPS